MRTIPSRISIVLAGQSDDPPDETFRLIARIIRGDEDAIREVYERTRRPVPAGRERK